MSDWKPIDTLKENVEAILYQPKGENQYEGMVIGTIERKGWENRKPPFYVHPSNISGYECECEIMNPTLWTELPRTP